MHMGKARGDGSVMGVGEASKEKKKAFCCYVSFFSFAFGGVGKV